jgi:hypothetical protein
MNEAIVKLRETICKVPAASTKAGQCHNSSTYMLTGCLHGLLGGGGLVGPRAQAFVDLIKVFVDSIKSFVNLIKVAVDSIKVVVNPSKALVGLIKMFIDLIKVLVDLIKEFVESLLGLVEPCLHHCKKHLKLCLSQFLRRCHDVKSSVSLIERKSV